MWPYSADIISRTSSVKICTPTNPTKRYVSHCGRFSTDRFNP